MIGLPPPCETRRPSAGYWLLAALLFLLPGCAELPDYAMPQYVSLDHSPEEVISYRLLTRDDFKAADPAGPPEAVTHLNARSSVLIKPSPTTRITIHSAAVNGRQLFFGNVQDLRFEAVFIPERSWWNPKIPPERSAYVLEHEQIHFAIMEIAARHLTADLADNRPGLPIAEYSLEAARKGVLTWLEDAVGAHLQDLLAEHEAFDRDASLYHAPRQQRRWWDHVQRRLQEQRQQ